MSCLGARIADLVDGRLAPDAIEQALAHAAGCERCRAELTEQRRIRSLLAHVQTPVLDTDLANRLVGVPAATAAAPSPADPARWGRRAAAAGGIAVVVGAAAAWVAGGATAAVSPPTPAVVVPAVDRFSAEHAACTGGMPLSAPGSDAAQVRYGVPATAPTVVPAAVPPSLP